MKKTIGALVVALAFIVGCSGDEGTAPPSAGQGRLRIYLTDAPAAYEAVNIAVVRVEVIRSENDTAGGRFIINNTPAVYDLLQLRNGAQVVLGDTTLPPGQYEQIRLIIGDGSNVRVDGTTHPLEVPSGPQTGVKLNHTITILPDALYELTLDFDAARSIVVTGNGRYKLKPVVRMQASQTSGGIVGRVLPLEAKPWVFTMAGGDTAAARPDTLTGDFRLGVLPEGTYALRVVPSDTTYRDSVLTGITVTRMQYTDVGTIELKKK